MRQRFSYAHVVLLVVLVFVFGAIPATAGRDCDATQEMIDTDYTQWIEFTDKIKPRVEEHSKNNLAILDAEIEIMNLRIKAVSSSSDNERRDLIDQYKVLEQEIKDIDRDEPRKTYYEDWEKLTEAKEALHTMMNAFINDCPLDLESKPPQ